MPSAATPAIAVGLGLQQAVREEKKRKRQEEKIHKYLLNAACQASCSRVHLDLI